MIFNSRFLDISAGKELEGIIEQLETNAEKADPDFFVDHHIQKDRTCEG